jgi:hypothetical protein
MSRRNPQIWTWVIVFAIAALMVLASLPVHVFAAGTPPDVRINTSEAKPRQVEETTAQAVTRDYASAWKSLVDALDHNRSEFLDASFVGIAHDRFSELVSAQKQNGLRQRIVDHGHRLDVVFYSADGSALQVRDTAQVEYQFMDGGTVVKSQQVTQHYLVLLTPAENSWKVRVIEELRNF